METLTNIFSSAYEQPENKLTYCFLTLLEHLDFTLASKVLAVSGISPETFEQLHVELLYGGEESNPDGSITLQGPKANLTIYFENKTWRRHLDIDQIKRHIQVHMKNLRDCRLLVITAEKEDNSRLAKLKDKRICFMTWHQVAETANKLASKAEEESKDKFLLSEFCEYLETSGEAWRAKMPDSKLIQANAQYLKVLTDRDRFLKECKNLMAAMLDDIKNTFATEISSADTADHWGRVGNECELKHAPFEQGLFYGVYYDTANHKIAFKTPYQAEFAVFFDFDKEKRENLALLPKIDRAISALKRQGFEFNFPENKCGNPWRVCYWREPMRKYAGKTPDDLRKMFETRLKSLFDSDFYKCAAKPSKRRDCGASP